MSQDGPPSGTWQERIPELDVQQPDVRVDLAIAQLLSNGRLLASSDLVARSGMFPVGRNVGETQMARQSNTAHASGSSPVLMWFRETGRSRNGDLWIQDYQPWPSDTVRWSVLDAVGRPKAVVRTRWALRHPLLGCVAPSRDPERVAPDITPCVMHRDEEQR